MDPTSGEVPAATIGTWRRLGWRARQINFNSLFPGAVAEPPPAPVCERGPRGPQRDSAVNPTFPAACLPAAAGADSAVNPTSPAACFPAAAGADSAVNPAPPAACFTAAAGADSAVNPTSPAACFPAAAGADSAVNSTSPAACFPAAAGAGPAVPPTSPAACLPVTANAADLRAISGRSNLSFVPTQRRCTEVLQLRSPRCEMHLPSRTRKVWPV